MVQNKLLSSGVRFVKYFTACLYLVYTPLLYHTFYNFLFYAPFLSLASFNFLLTRSLSSLYTVNLASFQTPSRGMSQLFLFLLSNYFSPLSLFFSPSFSFFLSLTKFQKNQNACNPTGLQSKCDRIPAGWCARFRNLISGHCLVARGPLMRTRIQRAVRIHRP